MCFCVTVLSYELRCNSVSPKTQRGKMKIILIIVRSGENDKSVAVLTTDYANIFGVTTIMYTPSVMTTGSN